MKMFLLAVATLVAGAPVFAGEFQSARFFKTEAQLMEAASALSSALDKNWINHSAPRIASKGGWFTYSMTIGAEVKHLAALDYKTKEEVFPAVKKLADTLEKSGVIPIEVTAGNYSTWNDGPYAYYGSISYISKLNLGHYAGLENLQTSMAESRELLRKGQDGLVQAGAKIMHTDIHKYGDRLYAFSIVYAADWKIDLPRQDSYAKYASLSEARTALNTAVIKLRGLGVYVFDTHITHNGSGFSYRLASVLPAGKALKEKDEYQEYETLAEAKAGAIELVEKKEKLGWTVMGYSIYKSERNVYIVYLDGVKLADAK